MYVCIIAVRALGFYFIDERGLISSNKKRPMVTILALAVASAMASVVTSAIASASRLPLPAMSILSVFGGNNKNYVPLRGT